MNLSTTAKVLREHSTWAEKKLWRTLRGRRLAAYKFRRQHGVGPYILDFYCGEARYSIELDGGQHGYPEQRMKDAEREEYLRSRNILTRRFWNRQLLDMRCVRETIWTDLQRRAGHPGNVQQERRVRLPTRPPKGTDLGDAHLSCR